LNLRWNIEHGKRSLTFYASHVAAYKKMENQAKDVVAAHLSDLGGVDNTSAAERSIIRRASTLTVELERLEARFATAGEASAEDIDLYARVAGNLRRLLEAVGLQRRARNVGAFIDGVSKTTELEWSPLRARLREEISAEHEDPA
jgi:hypothetical protein